MNRRAFILSAASGLAAISWRSRWPAVGGAVGSGSTVVTVDPRIELLNVIVYLGAFRGFAGNSPVTDLASPYLEDVERRFGRHRGHPAVARYERMARQGFWLTHPPSAALHLGDPPELAERIPVNDFTVRMAGGRPALDAFFADMRDFAAETEFAEWFRGMAGFHRSLADRYRRRMEWDYVEDLVDYFGDRRESYTLILAPLSHGGGFGPRVVRPDGRYDAFAVIGPRAVDDDGFDFGSGRSMRTLFWHEFAHSHVNHLTDRHVEAFSTSVDVLQGHLREEITRYVPWPVHVGDWISEHVVRGVTTRLAALRVGRAEAELALAREIQQYPYVGEVVERLKEFEADRRRYPDLERFYPRLVALFDEIAARERPDGG